MTRAWALTAAGGVSLLALAAALPAQSLGRPDPVSSAAIVASRPIGTFTPAVRDPRLAAYLEQRRQGEPAEVETAFRFTPAVAADESDRAVRVAVRVRPGYVAPQRLQPVTPGASPVTTTASGTPITQSSYNLGVAVGWRRFAVTGDVSNTTSNVAAGGRETTRIGVNYRANRRLTGRVQVEAERAEGVQRIVGDDRAVALDVGGAYSISRNLDVTGGVRYRVTQDRLEPLAHDERRDSQAVYVGTAFRF